MNNQTSVPVITIDGPSGTGKGTICQKLAAHLGWHLLDSGVIYRALAVQASNQCIDLSDINQLVQAAKTLDLQFNLLKNGKQQILLAGEDISQSIRNEDCGRIASTISVYPEVRQALLERQRDFASMPGLVTDGRDMGTVVFPEAQLKLYLDASQQERAKRRYLELKDKGIHVSLAEVVDQLSQRDKRDSEREHSPLKPANDAIIIDTTDLNITQVFNNVLNLVEERFGSS